MSDNQLAYQYGYLTITGKGDAAQLIEQYKLQGAEGWNAGEIAEERYQFEHMCIRINLGLLEQDESYFWWLSLKQIASSLIDIPNDLQLTLHIVTHGENYQNAGFHINRDAIRLLARLNAGFHLHGYRDADDGHNFPYAKVVAAELTSNVSGEQAYFYLQSNFYSSDYLQALINLTSHKKYNKGEIKRYHPISQQPIYQTISRIEIKSGLSQCSCITQHLTALLKILESQRTQIWQVAQDYHIELGITATGHVSNPHHRLISSALIARLAALGTDLDIDFYFNN